MLGRGGRGGRGVPSFSGGSGRGAAMQARDAAGRGGRGGGRRGRGRKTLNGNYMSGDRSRPEGSASAEESNKKLQQTRAEDALEEQLGFPLFTDGEDKLGWMMNMQASSAEDKDSGHILSAVDCYFMCQDGSMFKARVPFAPYFYLQVGNQQEFEVEAFLRRKFEGLIRNVEHVDREDLDLRNHLSGLKRRLLKVVFWNVQQMMEVRREVQPLITKNRAKARTTQAYADLAAMQANAAEGTNLQDVTEFLEDMREFDVPYHVRFAIDLDVRCGHWYTVRCKDGVTSLEWRSDLLQRAEPRVCAWDIECTKLPLQFPNAEYDQVFMISYMLDRQGYLITNMEVVGGMIEDFEYTPKPEFEGPFHIFNEPDERALLKRFFSHMQEVKPAVYVTYNGDFFDFPFVEKRAAKHDMDIYQELGFKTSASGEVLARHAVHMDCLHWVNRDSYLPQGSRGLKAVTKAKLGYDPVEVAPEDMVRMAAEQPQAMAAYSVSDAVSTYYLYMTYINPFIFSLATIIPLPPDEVLRKGSGTLCEQLLMVEAFKSNVVCPNKHASEPEVFYKGHLLDSETYIGGKVEAIESGVFRSDLPVRFKMKAAAYQGLIDRLDRDLNYAIEHECKMKMEDIANYAEVRDNILATLTSLRDTPNREEAPLIYHLDVAAMYPNIILTNRLQPPAIVTDEDCAACDFNKPGKTCLRQMEWVWRGEHYAATKSEYMAVKNQLQAEAHAPSEPGGPARYWEDLNQEERAKLLKDRLKLYTHKVYKRVHDKPITEERTANVCQKENDFYVGTVRAFRDRRYLYKAKNKEWKGKLDAAKGDALKTTEAADMCVLYESLQLAHKCILNSFYGYVMRKGARWYSMEMAGVVTYTGAKIIAQACKLVEQLGRPLELDTDGIWCALPASFPEVYKLKNKRTGKDVKISYPCIMLNVMLVDNNTNDQYQTLKEKDGKKFYEASKEMSIEFEVDGPYKAMILPASKEEGKTIKKRYAVFNDDGSLAELKGFEIKRRGELKLIKVFQAEVFAQFLAGSTLVECYHAVASVANRWLDLLDTQGCDLTDEELIDHISEATTMSKGVDEYEGRKSCAITCAKRLGAFLGDEQMRDKGLNCTYIISKKPELQSTTERAIPISIFSAEPAVARTFLRKWCGGDVGSAPADCVPDVRDIVDWDYYRERLGNTIQKIITIPAAMQGVANPVPRVRHPDWLHKKLADMNDKCQQLKLDAMMPMLRAAGAKNRADLAAGRNSLNGHAGGDVGDMEELGGRGGVRASHAAGGASVGQVTRVQGGHHANGTSNGGGGASTSGRADAAAAAAAAAAEAPCPSLRADFQGWVGHQKAKWRQLRGERKRRRLDVEAAIKARSRNGAPAGAGAAGAGAAAKAGGPKGQVGTLLRQHAAAVTAVPWQLLQLADTATPGRFKMWILADGRVHGVHLAVPRTIYVDSDVALDSAAAAGGASFSQATPGGGLMMLVASIPGATLQPVPNKVLPGGRKPCHLYEMSMPETAYVEAVPALSTALSAPHIRAVYEERLPLALSASLALGCVVKVAPHASAKALTADFCISDFKVRTTTEVGYLEPPPARQPLPTQEAAPAGQGPLGPGLRYVALIGSGDPTQGRAVYCLLMPSVARALLVVVQPSAAAVREVSPQLLERAWKEAAAAAAAAGEVDASLPTQVDWVVDYARDALDAGRVLQRALVAHKREQRGGIVCAVQAPFSSSHLASSAMPALSELPCMDVPSHADDSKYPSLQWQARAARRAVHRAAAVGGWVRERVALARYAHMPVSNLAGDSTVAVADVLFARNLRAAGHLLWVCDVTLPDLGVESKGDDGDVDDGGSVALPAAHVTLPPAAAGAAALAGGNVGAGAAVRAGGGAAGGVSPEVVSAGAYRSISVELKLHHLAVAAVQQAALLGDLEGSSSMEGASGSSGAAFKVLKNLVTAWLNDATNNLNFIADALLQSLYRWVCHPSSALRDPALQMALQTLMAKLFAQLVSEMRKLGAVIVAANFNTVIICTGKRDVESAVGYTHYLLEALRKRELYSLVHLAPQRWWHALLFRDPYNWGGIDIPAAEVATAKQQAGMVLDEEVPMDADVTEVEQPTVRFHWNLKEYLPPALQEQLVFLLTEFIYSPWKEAQAVQQQQQLGAGCQEAAGTQAAAVAHASEDVQASFLQKAVPEVFTERLLRLVGEAARLIPAASEQPEHQFPKLAGSYLSEEELGSPALAFVRTVCALMSLDARCVEAVSIMRRQLLKLLKVREFSAAADFKEVCLALTLPDVICSFCNDCRDLDLCRDAQLMAHGRQGGAEGAGAGGGGGSSSSSSRRAEEDGWHCRHCRQAYDMAALEQRLVMALNQHVRAYELQDLACVRCRAVSSSHLRSACATCGGDLRCTMPCSVRRTQLTVFRNVAAFHGFPLLLEMAEWLLAEGRQQEE